MIISSCHLLKEKLFKNIFKRFIACLVLNLQNIFKHLHFTDNSLTRQSLRGEPETKRRRATSSPSSARVASFRSLKKSLFHVFGTSIPPTSLHMSPRAVRCIRLNGQLGRTARIQVLSFIKSHLIFVVTVISFVRKLLKQFIFSF